MMLFLAFVAAICALLFVPLKSAFLGNPALNSVILATLGRYSLCDPANPALNTRTELVAVDPENRFIGHA